MQEKWTGFEIGARKTDWAAEKDVETHVEHLRFFVLFMFLSRSVLFWCLCLCCFCLCFVCVLVFVFRFCLCFVLNTYADDLTRPGQRHGEFHCSIKTI